MEVRLTNPGWIQSIVVLSMIAIQSLLLYVIPRSNFYGTFGLFLALFALYIFIVKSEKYFSFTSCIVLAIVLRLIALFALPALSDDYFRFIWDGRMVIGHVNPYQYTPQEYLQIHPGDIYLKYLYENMNSPEYHTIYPPVLQYLFSFAVLLFPKNAYNAVLIMKLFILLAECVTIRILYLYAKLKGIEVRNILWYVLNPLIIIELTGNVHFEGVLLCFFISALYYLERKRNVPSAILWGLSIATKFTPLIIAPILLPYLGLKKFFKYGLVSLVIVSLLFIPFINKHLIGDLNSSVKLFYHLFEFNASVIYFVRWVGYHFVSYDIMEFMAPVLGVISFVFILIISWWPSKKEGLIEKSIWVFFVYFLFSTMLHPWYTSTLILLSVFSRYKFPVVFSLLVLLSYFPYGLKIYEENLAVIAIEYSLLFGYIIWEKFSVP